MNEENILLNIEFNNSDIQAAVKNITEGRKQIDSLIEANKKLVEQGQKNSQSYVQNELAIKALNTEVANNSKIVQANSQAVKANADSIEGLKQRNKELLKERNLLSTSTEEGRKKIEALNDEYDKNSAIIADNSTKVEKQRFNIGNYSSALGGISPQLGAFSANLGNAQKESGGLTAGLGSMTKAALGFVATPLGAVITAIVLGFKLLSTWLTNTTDGLDFLEDVAAGVGTVINVLKDNIGKLVGIMGKLIAFDFSGAVSDFKDLGDEIAREVSLTLDLNAALRELEDAEINYEIATSKTANKIKELLLQSKNRTISEQERIKILEEADKLEADRVNTLIKNREEALRIANEDANKKVELARIAGESEDEFAQRLLDTGKLLDDQRDKVKDAVIAFNNALGDGITVREKIQNQQDALAEKAEADAQKRADAEKKRLDDIQKKKEEIAARDLTAANALELLRLDQQAKELSGLDERTAKFIEIENTKRAQLLENQKLTEKERQLIIAESEQAISDIQKDADIQRIADEHEREQTAIEFEKELLATKLADFEEYTQELINAEKEKLLQGVISQEEYNQEMADLELASLEAQALIKEQYGERDLALEGRVTDYKIALGQKEVEAKKIQEQAKVDAVQKGLGTIASAFNRQSVAFKVLASVQTLITTYQSAISAFNSLANIPYIGTVLGIAAAAAATANGLAAVARINSAPLPKLEQGGMLDLDGPRHSHGGMDVTVGGKRVANVEGGEKMVILKRGSSPLLKMLSNINQLVGGRDFYNDKTPRYFNQDGGFVARSAAANGARTSADFQLQNLSDQIGKLKIYTVITDIQKADTNQNRANVVSELS